MYASWDATRIVWTFYHDFGYIIENENLNFCYPKHQIIKIINNEAPNKKYFSMIKLYNNYCYLVEDPNVYGYYNESESSITWYHLDKATKQTYKLIKKNTIIKIWNTQHYA